MTLLTMKTSWTDEALKPMKIALVADGVSEYRSMPYLYSQLYERTGNRIISTMKVSVSPLAPEPVIVRHCLPLILAAKLKAADRVVVILDREGRPECSGSIAASLQTAISAKCLPAIEVFVVIKDRTFENWLIADVDALAAQPRRFRVSQSLTRSVRPDKADACDGVHMLKRAAVDASYEKVEDSVKICRKLDVSKAAQHSRSLRRFLRVIEDRTYSSQSRMPADAVRRR